MRKLSIFTSILILILVSIFVVSGTACSKVYVASGHPEWAPIMYRDGDLITGAGADLVKIIAADLKLPVEIKYAGTWDKVQEKAKSGEVDILVAAYKTQERETYMVYSNQYTTDPNVVITLKKKGFNYSSWRDLSGKRGVLTAGDSYGKFDEYIGNLNTVRVKTVKEAFDMLEKDQADYFIYALYAAEKFIYENGLGQKVEICSSPVSVENFYITISKKSPLVDQMDKINAVLEKYKKDGTVDKLIQKYRKKN